MKKRLLALRGPKPKKRHSNSLWAGGFEEYQRRARETIHGEPGAERRAITSLLGLASETGSILDSYKRYLRDSIAPDANREFLKEELGDLLWYIAAVATSCDLDLGEIADANLRRVAALAKKKRPQLDKPKKNGRSSEALAPARSATHDDFSRYQSEAKLTSRLNLLGPDGPIAPMAGLASATGSILSYLKSNSENLDFTGNKKFFVQNLGDLLWYVSAVATASHLDLGEIADANLERSHDLYTISSKSPETYFIDLPNFDKGRIPTERFPRHLIIRFEDREVDGRREASQTVVSAEPNAFPNGPIMVNGKLQGFTIGTALGDTTNDNSRRKDGYRFHDAIHLAFAAVLGWSPVQRSLLRLKRRSDRDIDDEEDGARAIYTEEGLSAILSRLAPRRMGFLGENTVDGQVIATAKAAVEDLEVKSMPGWLWRRAIAQGFRAMDELTKNGGGFLAVDLDNRQLVYSKMRPHVPTKRSH